MIHQPPTLHGSSFAWVFLGSVFGAVSNMATLVTNNPGVLGSLHESQRIVLKSPTHRHHLLRQQA